MAARVIAAPPALARLAAPATRRWWVAAWLVGLAAFTAPAAVNTPGVGLDPSWQLGLAMAARDHLQWGTQAVFTYGPYGFLISLEYYYFGTWLLALAATLVVHSVLFLALAAYLVQIEARPWKWVLVGLVFALPTVPFLTLEYEDVIAVMLLLFVAGVTSRRAHAILCAATAGALIGLLLTVKTTGMAVNAGLLVPYAVYVVVTRRALSLVPLVVVGCGTFLALWIAAGQEPGSIGPYFRSAYEVISGYTAAMSVLYDYPVQQVPAQIAFGVLGVASSGLTLLWALARRDRELVCLILLASPLLFFVFKEGYVRFGDRQLLFYALVTVIETLVFVRVVDAAPGRLRAAGAVQAGAAAGIAAVHNGGAAYAVGGVHLRPVWPVSTLGARLDSYRLASALVVRPERRAALRANGIATMQSYYQLSGESLAGAQGVDVIPWDIDVVYAYGLPWNPRPVLQSYSAYTPYLDGLDAAHLAGPDAPSRLLVSDMSIDGRYAAFDEPAAFRAMAGNYEVAGQDGSMLVLSRRMSAVNTRLRTLGTVHAHLGQNVDVPTVGSGSVYAVVRVPYSVRGELTNLLFQPAELRVRFSLPDGESGPYRFVPSVAADGLLVSNYIGTTKDLSAYLDGRPTRPIRAFQVTSDGASDYTGAVDVTFYASA